MQSADQISCQQVDLERQRKENTEWMNETAKQKSLNDTSAYSLMSMLQI